ncbi:hypothetical protein [Limnospira fusiformis]|nr:hypothetical protein [Limnoraphis robusta]
MLKPTNHSLSIVNPQPPRNPHPKAIAPLFSFPIAVSHPLVSGSLAII